ncbi:hypothetical protein [Pajaroellobacter abortibovis]|uniref:N-acetylmuramoyl-L-alanine amidase domain-containing protein n=1 Tax=Pajaroellobacter abortibovis TaxID=1882918 RepID=A0A1L6MW95_9BACT|nr:hypothetical protein [Pajaroellobacter abortibovis]APR99791.1 hypothetical protein BCY86_03200 [Pajaroellobacter abortibovis]
MFGHADIAPGWKWDPGPLFHWKRLYDHGIGAWSDEQEVPSLIAGKSPQQLIRGEERLRSFQEHLKQWEYLLQVTGKLDEQTEHVVNAFHMHFLGEENTIPPEETKAVLHALIRKYPTERT